MATQLFLNSLNADYSSSWITSGESYLIMRTSAAYGTTREKLETTRGAGVTSKATSSVAGPMVGLEATPYQIFWSRPLAAAVTISGSITFNLWAMESSMSANAAANFRVWRYSRLDGSFTEIIKTVNATELGTSNAAQNWSETPAAGVDLAKGDRIAIMPFYDDASGVNMASGYTLTHYYSGTTGGASGDSYVTFTENLTFQTDAPTGTSVYLTSTAAGINPGSNTEYQAWTSRGAGVTSATVATVDGPTAPIPYTVSSTAVEWYTKPLQAVTLSGPVLANLRVKTTATSTEETVRCQIALCDNSGTEISVWAMGGGGTYESDTLRKIGLDTTERPTNFWVMGSDLSISDGQRLRIRAYIDDPATYYGTTMSSGFTDTLYYNGTSGGASGDSYLQFPVTLAEYTGGGGGGDDVMPFFGGGYYP